MARSHRFSYRLLLLILLTFETARRLTTADPNDGACLKNLRQSLEDPAGFLRSWKNSVLSDPCSGFNLHGVTCSTNGRISDLSLNNLFLRGTISPFLLNCTNLQSLDLSSNQISGVIPPEIQFLVNLVALNLSSNHLSGKFTPQIALCAYLNVIDLHDNRLSGQIPQQLGLLARLSAFDVSNNKLSGQIPTYLSNRTWYFPRINASSFIGNKGLYGYPLQETKHSSYVKKVAIGVSVGIALLLLLFEALVFLRWFRKRKKNQQANNLVPSTLEIFHEKISYGDLRNATDGFSSRNIVGSGSFGTVFKALLPTENKIIAVKVLNLKRRGAMKSFMAECESLKDIRHRNLVKLLTACSSIDFQGNEFRALIYEFMPNGSLDKWLHPEEVEEIRRPSRTLTLLERLNMAIDVASALDYLHVHCHEPIAHCDLKPSNILLDDDLTARVSDFGLARLLLKFDQESFFNQLSSAGVRGTIGYAAPEYGMGGQPSIQGDVYSFGVFILEMFTGKRPTNELFGGNFTLHSYIKSALPERVLNAADKSILRSGLRVGFPIAECLVLVFKVGLRCCEESPRNRLAMSEVLKELISIKERFFRAIRTARR